MCDIPIFTIWKSYILKCIVNTTRFYALLCISLYPPFHISMKILPLLNQTTLLNIHLSQTLLHCLHIANEQEFHRFRSTILHYTCWLWELWLLIILVDQTSWQLDSNPHHIIQRLTALSLNISAYRKTWTKLFSPALLILNNVLQEYDSIELNLIKSVIKVDYVFT